MIRYDQDFIFHLKYECAPSSFCVWQGLQIYIRTMVSCAYIVASNIQDSPPWAKHGLKNFYVAVIAQIQ